MTKRATGVAETRSAATTDTGPVAIRLGGGASVHVDGWTNARTAFQLDGRVQITGRFDHTPTAGGSSTYIRHMRVGPSRSRIEPEPEPVAKRAIHGSPVTFTRAPGKTCRCGFEAFNWQRVCPKCRTPI